MNERRKSPRMRATKSATLVLGGYSAIECAVRDLSDLGVQIKIPDTIKLPQQFDITFDGGRSARCCRLVWRNFSATGLEFLEIGSSTRRVRIGGVEIPRENLGWAPCPKCQSLMTGVAITRHPIATRMLKHTYVCRTCNQTRSYVLPAPFVEGQAAFEIMSGDAI